MASSKEDTKEKERFLAVVLAENFNENLQPLTRFEPLVLTPLINTPLLDYTLDWMLRCGVDETLVYCIAQPHAEKIRAHCRGWIAKNENSMIVTVISSENCTSLGDAMRDLYSKSLLKTNFLLMTGDVIGNLDLKDLLEQHKTTHAKDPNAVMSCVYIKRKRINSQIDRCRLAKLIISNTGKMLDHSRPRPDRYSKLSIPSEVIQANGCLRALRSIEDPNIAICSHFIPSLFSDNFDYGTRDSLVQGIIEQEELLGYTIYAQIIDEDYYGPRYAAQISSFKAYQEVSESILKRLNFPFVPERSLSSHRIRYNYQSLSGNYWDASSKYHKKSIGNNVVIDAGTEINPKSNLTNTVIGKHCTVRENVRIQDSFIFSNVTISQGCILDNCLVDCNVKLLPGVHLEPGVVIGPNVVLGPNLKVERCTRLMAEPPMDSFGFSTKSADFDPLVCGREGKAYKYEKEDQEARSFRDLEWGEKLDNKDLDEIPTEDSDINSDNDPMEEEFDNQAEEEAVVSDEEREKEFTKEVKDSLLNALKEKSVSDNVVLEINSSRHAYNVTMEDVLICVTKEVLHVGEETGTSRLSGEDLWKAVHLGLQAFADVLRNYVKKPKDQLTVLKAIEENIDEDSRYLSLAHKTLYELNQELEILDDEVIIYWYSKGGSQTAAFPSLSKIIAKFVQWLQEEEESEEEEED